MIPEVQKSRAQNVCQLMQNRIGMQHKFRAWKDHLSIYIIYNDNSEFEMTNHNQKFQELSASFQ